MTLIIAEAGVNHNGDEKLAFELVKAASEAGADIVKFQTFKAESLVSIHGKQAEYQRKSMGVEESQLSMLKRLELPFDTYIALAKYCAELGIEFLSTAFDSESLSFLVNNLALKRLKIPSGELTNAPFLLEHARTGCDLILSTGMASIDEIEAALGVLAFGMLSETDKAPSKLLFEQAYSSKDGKRLLKDKVTILHCTSAYPAPVTDINLRAINTLNATFGLRVGYSDHSKGIAISTAAVACGATVIEKHFTLDKNMEGPDHKASLEPKELSAMVNAIREVEQGLGHAIKAPTASELENKDVSRKSLVAQTAIIAGESFTKENVVIKRPGNGMSPYLYWSLLDKQATKDYLPGDLIVE
ncbi:N-acetylneuraminate synthase [Marinomonas mediterranea]|jgi:N-acetylneuraminate synthase (EC 2.5.1.56)|uniref:N-acetylneuraminate synthase n=1 Tax=Marinomonas mediterranea (strain ATCC 700492 / JCM 21426 / NBRC 103028 / MMB-1) TaxID=717774 RepID=F2K4C1_MARM1|nr:N-acetylneuraminate synthase [Marinomonas mediterranea]ADZ92562.1 N-acetylneuraminate synthase [Marinomonas mediterranea MMB-1]WCN10506.1 N-acetylneuraminate synthase [Marinomonas mediterranea]WCN14556.1 N-acetylneuraminate synthase [Marinomonas mediterranea]WCN18605.1 N-acetylneuraminate synthase [Marinomonas mediterranea MMB-1]